MFKLLIIEDDLRIAKNIKEYIQKWGIEVKLTTDFNRILEDFKVFNPHIVLIDIFLPYYDGFYWCQKIREISNVPIIFISSASDNMNIVMAMNIGADDFVVKPFDLDVLNAKINALLRRTYSFQNALFINYKDIQLNLNDQTVLYKNEKIALTRNEFKILKILLENTGKVVSREKLIESLWKSDSFVDENTLTVNINRLRKKFKDYGLLDLIKTKFGVGYLID